MVTTISFPVCQRFPDILQNWRDCEHGWIANSVLLLHTSRETKRNYISTNVKWFWHAMQVDTALHSGLQFQKYCKKIKQWN